MKNKIPQSKFFWLRKLVSLRQSINDIWHVNSGDWEWLADNSIPVKGLNRKLWRASVPTASFYMLIGLSAIISTFGLLANSAATIIGAMIVAPLMGPIIGMAYALVVGNRRLLKRSALTTFLGTVLCILVSLLIAYPLGFETFGPEVTGRIHPSLLDMGVALAAGAVGAYAQSRRQIAEALPGVAIAVALVPPLSVIGIGLAIADYQIAGGAALLFVTNLIGIVFSGCLIFIIQNYGSVERAKAGLIAGLLSLIVLAIPLGFSLRTLLTRENVRRDLVSLLRRRTLTFKNISIESVSTEPMKGGGIKVDLEVIAQSGSITQKQVQLVRDFLSEQFEQPIRLKLKVIPADFFEE